MMTSIHVLAKDHETFIREQLTVAENALLPSSSEDEELVRRAVFSVRNKSVVFERYSNVAVTLHATVQDVRPASVEIDFLNETIVCSCPQKNWCRHKLGVLLGLYQQFGSVQDWSSAWRAKKTVQLRQLANERTPESWLKMADEVLSRILPAGQKLEIFMFTSIREDAMTKLKHLMPFEREWQPLYKLFMEIAIISSVWQHVNRTETDYQNGHFKYFVERSRNAIDEAIDELYGRSRLFATDPFYDSIQKMLRAFLLARSGEFAMRLDIYMLLWEVVLYEKGRREEELKLLETLASGNTSPELSRIVVSEDVNITAALTLFYILLGKEAELETVEHKINPKNVINFYDLASFAKRNEEMWATERLSLFMLPHLKSFIYEWLMPTYRAAFVRDVHSLYEGIKLTLEQEMTLFSSFGMYGLQPFSSYLISNGRYGEWAALHQLYPSSISYLELCGLKDVLVEAPAVTLPLYHVYAMEEIRQRSRMNYKQAVRIWKSMKTAAKKAGKTAYFETYMQTVRAQYKRLRALQEEIERGNLST